MGFLTRDELILRALVLAGTLERNGKQSMINGGQFLGELAFLQGSPASASGSICAGSDLIVWNEPDLRRIMDRSPTISNAIVAQFNKDIAGKLALSWPEQSG